LIVANDIMRPMRMRTKPILYEAEAEAKAENHEDETETEIFVF